MNFTFCTDNSEVTKKLKQEDQLLQQTDSSIKKISTNTDIKVKVNFVEHKELLDVILLLPDSAFPGWEWKLEERKVWYNEIKEHDFYTDKNPDFFNQTYLKQNSAKFLIADGSWSVSLYRTSDNSSIVITDGIVGDGNEIYIYEIKSNKILRTADIKAVFGDYVELIKQKDDKKDCGKKYEELNDPIFFFNFSDRIRVEIESSWYLLKDNYSDCLKGNALSYKFNPDTKKFDLTEIYWKPKTKD